MPSPVSVGIDLVEVERFARVVRDKPRLLDRMFTANELATCLASRNANDRLAGRFAAKEATFKALGSGWPSVPYHDVEIISAPNGAPTLVLRRHAAALAGGRNAAVSISHTAGLAVAEVVLSTREGS
jgi:holo-[acyl-carrier protein] synthase